MNALKKLSVSISGKKYTGSGSASNSHNNDPVFVQNTSIPEHDNEDEYDVDWNT